MLIIYLCSWGFDVASVMASVILFRERPFTFDPRDVIIVNYHSVADQEKNKDN